MASIAPPATTQRAPVPISRAGVRWVPAAMALAVLVGVLAWTMISGWLAEPTYTPGSSAARAFEDRTGIRLVRVAVTGASGLVNVSYRVLDPSKAAQTLGEDHVITVTDEATGMQLAHPWMGHSAHPLLQPAITYFSLIEDTDQLLSTGSLVTLQIGDSQLQHVPVG